ncbi:MAG TPA: DUF1579 family protein [Humisphaera sp.]|jgi:hypothetical protein|nr:DUF1579 family protein [Humisphaera sp.]
MTRRELLTVAISYSISSTVTAADPPTTQRDPQAAYEPRSGPGEGQKFLAKLAGEWDVVKTFHPRSGEPSISKGHCRQAMIHDGRFLQSDFTFADAAGQTTGLGIIGFDAGKFTSFWTDSRATRMSIRESEEPFDGKQIVLHSKSLDDPNARKSRTLTVLEDQGRRLVHRQFTAGTDGAERIVMELMMTRIEGKKA